MTRAGAGGGTSPPCRRSNEAARPTSWIS